VQLLWEWDFSHADGEKRMVVRAHKPLNGDSLVARWSDDWGLLVNGLFDGERVPTDRGFAHFFTDKEREATIVHMHNPEDADYYEPELAGQIRGSGVRGHVYWYWWLASNFMALAEDFAERFANGVWKAYYDESNPLARSEMEEALASYKSSHVLFLPRNKGTMQAVNDTVIEQVNSTNPGFIFEIVQYLRDKIRKYITGSNVSMDNEVNLGGDSVSLGRDNLSKITKYDAERLAETITAQWMPVLTKYNCEPGTPPPYFRFDCDKPNADAILGHAVQLMEMGSSVDLDYLHEICGVPRGNPGDNVASKLQNFQPLPEGTQQPQQVPAAGDAGPVDPNSQEQSPQPDPSQQVTSDVQNPSSSAVDSSFLS
jgi:hypothetical protein